jgi:hypothetical protein
MGSKPWDQKINIICLALALVFGELGELGELGKLDPPGLPSSRVS